MISSEKVAEGRCRLRVYYRSTPQGERYLVAIRAEYDSINGGSQRILHYTNRGENEDG